MNNNNKTGQPYPEIPQPYPEIPQPYPEIPQPYPEIPHILENIQTNVDQHILNNQVAFSNTLLRSLQTLTINEKKLFILAASKLKVGTNPLGEQYPLLTSYNQRTVVVTANEFSVFSMINKRLIYRALDKAANGLFTKKSVYQYTDIKQDSSPPQFEERTMKFNWLESINYPTGSGQVEITFTSLMMFKALQVHENFSTYHLYEVQNLNSFYSLRLHEIFCSYKNRKLNGPINKNFDFIELKTMLNAPLHYKWPVFNQKILEPALAELKAAGLWTVGITTKKTGRTITGVQFKLQHHLSKGLV